MAGVPRLPGWLQLTADSKASTQISRSQFCPEQTVRKETCFVEQVDGISVLRCEELIERFRLCADGHREMVESTTRTHIRPYSSDPSSSSRYDDVMDSVAPIVSSTLGQMLDDFFQYATELQNSLEEQGVHTAHLDSKSSSTSNRSSSPSRWRFPGTVKAEAAASIETSSNGGLFGWWLRKKAAKSSGDQQPSLQQLVRESSSHTQEI